jgi:hypothetical protein
MWDSVYTRSISICEATTTPSLQEGYVTGRRHHYQFSPGTSRTNPLSTTSSYQRRNVGCHHHRHTTTTLGVYGGTQQSELTFSNVRLSRIQPPTPHPCHKGSMQSCDSKNTGHLGSGGGGGDATPPSAYDGTTTRPNGTRTRQLLHVHL